MSALDDLETAALAYKASAAALVSAIAAQATARNASFTADQAVTIAQTDVSAKANALNAAAKLYS